MKKKKEKKNKKKLQCGVYSRVSGAWQDVYTILPESYANANLWKAQMRINNGKYRGDIIVYADYS